jgi:hypothetical protein
MLCPLFSRSLLSERISQGLLDEDRPDFLYTATQRICGGCLFASLSSRRLFIAHRVHLAKHRMVCAETGGATRLVGRPSYPRAGSLRLLKPETMKPETMKPETMMRALVAAPSMTRSCCSAGRQLVTLARGDQSGCRPVRRNIEPRPCQLGHTGHPAHTPRADQRTPHRACPAA